MKHYFARPLLMSLLALTLLFQSAPAKPATGFLFGSSGLITVGLYATTGGPVLAGTSYLACYLGLDESGRGHGPGCQTSLWGVITGAFALFLGVLILENDQIILFNNLSYGEAIHLGVSEAERLSYNSEIDQVNALAAYVDAELSKISKPGIEDSRILWESVRGSVSPLTFQTLQKISAQVAR